LPAYLAVSYNRFLLHKSIRDALETHDRLSGMMIPGADPKVIYGVNRAMDNPDPWSIGLNSYLKQSGHSHAFDIPGLRKYGHREPNHNWMSVMMTGYMYGEKRGCTLLQQTI
jgi:hypothetical protein